MTPKNAFRLFLTAVLGILSGWASVAAIALVSRGLFEKTVGPFDLMIVFAFAAVAAQIARFLSNFISLRIAESIRTELRIQVIRQVMRVPLNKLENIGAARIVANLSSDSHMIAHASVAISHLAVQSAIVVGALGYVAWLSPYLCLGVLGVVGLIITPGWFMMQKVGSKNWRNLAERNDDVLAMARDLTDGIKELKFNVGRRVAFEKEVVAQTLLRLRKAHYAAFDWHNLQISWSDTWTYAILGAVVFFAPLLKMEASSLSGAMVTLIWAINAFGAAIGMVPVFAQGNASKRRMNQLIDRMRGASEMSTDLLSVSHATIRLENVTFEFPTSAEMKFGIGPLNIAFEPGELTFISGGNGSGKTTFAKVLSGLYLPTSGTIWCDDEVVTDSNQDWYRQRYSAVFQEFHVFEDLLGLRRENLDSEANALLAKLGLSKKMSAQDGRLSPVGLSRGELKRLALLVVLLEDKPICLLDEWAADQDPSYREVFYHEILPEMRDRGKCIIAISHDDRYYGVADRVVHLEEGRISRIYSPRDEAHNA